MREIKLTGRERTIIRAIGFGLGCPGSELVEQTRLDRQELMDALNGLMEVGLVETTPYYHQVTDAQFDAAQFEVNPGYSHAVKQALGKA